jgi:hypothetical protein
MKIPAQPENEPNAKQRLAISRQLLAATLEESLWASLTRRYIRRCLPHVQESAAPQDQGALKAQSDRVTNGRTPS